MKPFRPPDSPVRSSLSYVVLSFFLPAARRVFRTVLAYIASVLKIAVSR